LLLLFRFVFIFFLVGLCTRRVGVSVGGVKRGRRTAHTAAGKDVPVCRRPCTWSCPAICRP
jgi:hypothetical protein